MPSIDRIDFSKPPPGYCIDCDAEMWWIEDDCLLECGTGDKLDEAVTVAWAHYKTRRDPPGKAKAMGRAAAWAIYIDALEVADLLEREDIRRVMERDGDACPLPGDHPWPRALTWTAEQRAEVRHWLDYALALALAQATGVPSELPEVLRVR